MRSISALVEDVVRSRYQELRRAPLDNARFWRERSDHVNDGRESTSLVLFATRLRYNRLSGPKQRVLRDETA